MQGALIDIITHKKYPLSHPNWKSDDGNIFDLEWQGMFDPLILKNRPHNLWRYREAIPVLNDENIVSFQEGFTPLLTLDISGNKIQVKQEQMFTTGSYKDRGAAVLMSHVREVGIKRVVQDSSGNAGCAVAAYAAASGILCDIYLQEDTSPSKTAQMKMYGANIHYINGTREDAARAALHAAESIYYASHSYNPFFFHGTKTFAYEIGEQLNWKLPDAVVLPAGNGTLILGCYIGFMDLLRAGIASRMPKIIAVQAANCAPLAHAFFNGKSNYEPIVTSPTLAEGIAIASPIRGNQMLHMVKDTNGGFITVSESEIKAAWKICGALGHYIEPTSAATIAGAMSYMENNSSEQIVTLFSGNGLKSTDKVLTYFF